MKHKNQKNIKKYKIFHFKKKNLTNMDKTNRIYIVFVGGVLMDKAILKKKHCKNFLKNMNYDNIFNLDSSSQSNNTNIKSVVKK